ncbi:MAG: PAS domain-containing protein [Candidatus Eremiobacteraeota bacterium]|nr:PAS domain-containing protein [Candidatus Eremiobacteraeota bacterium]
MPHRYNPLFTPENVRSAREGRGEMLHHLPFGVVIVNRNATIVDYNENEDLAVPKEDIVGKNFFEEIAPWAADAAFKGRWDEFVSSCETLLMPFDFTLPGPHGPVDVTIMFVRANFDSDHATICIARKAKVATA